MPLREYSVTVDYVSEGEVAALLRGYILVGGEKIRFSGVAYGRFGGQNVMPKLSPASKKKVQRIFGDAEKFEQDLQMRLVNGDFDTKASGPHVHQGATQA